MLAFLVGMALGGTLGMTMMACCAVAIENS